MTTFQAITLGAVQGLTEFLPVSSTAHLILVPWAFGWTDPGLTYDVALHIGTFVAVLVYFARDLWLLTVAWCRSFVHRDPADPYQRLAWLILLGTLPAAVIGVLAEKWVETTLRSPLIVGSSLLLVAIAILAIDRGTSEGKAWKDVQWLDALLIGFGQAAALIPGVSRSGSTMLVGLLRGLDRGSAARISFLLGTPIIFGSAVFKLKDLITVPPPAEEAGPFVVGILTSGLVGYACIRFLLRYLARKPLALFMYYRIVLGTLVIGLTLSGVLRPVPAATHTAAGLAPVTSRGR